MRASWNKWLLLLGHVLVLLISLSGVFLGFLIFQRTLEQSFQTLPLSRGWMYLALPVGFIFMAIHIIENTLKLLRNSEIDSSDQTVEGS